MSNEFASNSRTLGSQSRRINPSAKPIIAEDCQYRARSRRQPPARARDSSGKDHPLGPVAHPKNRNTRNSDASAVDAGRGLAERRGVKGRIEHAPLPRSYGREGCLALADEMSMTTARMFKLKPCDTKRVHR